MTRLLAISLTISAFFHPLHAAELKILAWDDEVASMKLAINDSKGSTPIETMHPAKRSKTYKVTAGEVGISILTLDKKDETGKPIASAIQIPPGTNKPLLLLLPDEKSLSGLRLLVIEDATGKFPWGSFQFINASNRKMHFVFGKQGVSLPASWKPVIVKPSGGNRSDQTHLYFFDQPKRPIYSAVWERKEDVRILIFIIPSDDPRLGPVAMKMITEDRRVLAAQAQAEKAPGANSE